MSPIPAARIRDLNGRPVRGDAGHVLYWMTAQRRLDWNFALQRAVEWAQELRRPLVILEPLRVDYAWASVRHHRFVIEGMRDNAIGASAAPVTYYPYVETRVGVGKGLLAAWARDACLVVTDDWPAFFHPRMVASAARQVPCLLEAVDGCGLFPVRQTDRVFTTAFSFRNFLQKNIEPHLGAFPKADPLAGAALPRLEHMPAGIETRWPAADLDRLLVTDGLDRFPISQRVPAAPVAGGPQAAKRALHEFLDRLPRYGEDRNQPANPATSGLSPHLHFGHISPHAVFSAVVERSGGSLPEPLTPVGGKSRGFWGLADGAEGFLDQLVTWRELGFNMCAHVEHYDRYESLPDWARRTLADHAGDPRPHLYDLDTFDAGRTHDEIWNAAQRQLVSEGVMHNYLRMLWGKKILHWSRTPQEALATMIDLNNRYALDGRDPNSYSGIFWTLGRYDRPWGPEREVFGKVRYMSSDSTRRKLRLGPYLARYGGGTLELPLG